MSDDSTTLTRQLFEQLFRQNERKYIAIAFRYVQDVDVAKDVVHDSLLTVWEHRDQIQTNIEAYIYRVVRNKCLRYRQEQQTGKAVFEQIKQQESGMMDYYTKTIESCNPEALFQSEIMDIVAAQLRQMPALTQEIFRAKKFEDKSYKEIADQFGITTKRVDKELQNAVSKLRLSLKDYLMIMVVGATFLPQ